jgi:DNA-directed RNA polymerase subunit M/transcription elongation factor TFIIS
MEMGSKKRINRLKAQGELYKCPSCGYEDGFHVSFQWRKRSLHGEIFLICPNCHSRFRLGWNISIPKTAN